MNININTKEIELKYTFNSFRYMQDLNIEDLNTIETYPFRMVPIAEMLLLGATNNNPKVRVTPYEVSDYLESYIEENAITDLMEELMNLLQESNFFKSLQKNQPQPSATTKKQKK